MVFSSSVFLFCFLPLVLLGNTLLPKSWRNTFLLLASLGFYAWGGMRYALVMMLSIACNYLLGLGLAWGQGRSRGMAQFFLWLAVSVNLGLLFYYKYTDFFLETVNALLGTHVPLRHILLPIGISFYTFQSLSYIFDLYRGEVAVQRNPMKLALYVSLFPQLIAGPIVRYKDVAAQIDSRTQNLPMMASGVRRFIMGLAKKVLLANALGQVTDKVFAIPLLQHSAATLWVAMLCYAMQIYFDFSGYSDMAIGLGRMLGFTFLENFNYPYISRSLTEFWRRWHISLSTWFRDYVYIPLGGSRKGNVYLNLLVVFFLTGLWHGAAWTFVLWGLWHGAFLMLERVLRNRQVRPRIPGVLRWAYTMLVVLVGWVLFRAESLPQALTTLRLMFGLEQPVGVGFSVFWYLTPSVVLTLIIGALACVPWRIVLAKPLDRLKERPAAQALRTAALLPLLLLSLMAVMTSSYNPFIYFRF